MLGVCCCSERAAAQGSTVRRPGHRKARRHAPTHPPAPLGTSCISIVRRCIRLTCRWGRRPQSRTLCRSRAPCTGTTAGSAQACRSQSPRGRCSRLSALQGGGWAHTGGRGRGRGVWDRGSVPRACKDVGGRHSEWRHGGCSARHQQSKGAASRLQGTCCSCTSPLPSRASPPSWPGTRAEVSGMQCACHQLTKVWSSPVSRRRPAHATGGREGQPVAAICRRQQLRRPDCGWHLVQLHFVRVCDGVRCDCWACLQLSADECTATIPCPHALAARGVVL